MAYKDTLTGENAIFREQVLEKLSLGATFSNSVKLPPMAADAEFVDVAFLMPFNGKITGFKFYPNLDYTGNPTDERIITYGVGSAVVTQDLGFMSLSFGLAPFVSLEASAEDCDFDYELNEGDVIYIASTIQGAGIVLDGGLLEFILERID